LNEDAFKCGSPLIGESSYMKIAAKSSLILFFLFHAWSFSAKAQYADLTFNPLSALTGTAVVMVEVPAGKAAAIELQSSYFFEANRFWRPYYRTSGYRVGGLVHLYVNSGKKHTGWSVFPYVRYLNSRNEAIEEANTTFDRDSYELTQMTVGFGGSFKHVFGEHFVLGVAGGLGRNFARKLVRDEGETGDFFSLGFQATALIDVYGRITVGYRLIQDKK